MAISRGAEGLLAVATRAAPTPYARLVLISPSSVTWQAIGSDGSIPDTPSWTYEGQPLPWLPTPTGAIMPQLIRNAWQVGAGHQGPPTDPAPAAALVRGRAAGAIRADRGRDHRRGATRPGRSW